MCVCYGTQSGKSGGECADQATYENEQDKPSTPSKEELELNERNLSKESAAPPTAATTRLGKLHFKLRSVKPLSLSLRSSFFIQV